MFSHLKYLHYVLTHKWYVFTACISLDVPIHQAIIHDWQKFTPTEWFPYVHTFFGNKPSPRDSSGNYDPTKVSTEFDRAWLHHQHYGPHHWQHWLLRQDDGQFKILEMPHRFAREMVADWIGAGKALGKPDMEKWFLENKKNIVLHENTLDYVTQRIADAKQKGLIP